MFAIQGKARSRGPRDGSRTDWENRLRDRIDGRSEDTHRRAPRVRAATAADSPGRPVFSLATAISRVLGLFREMVSAYPSAFPGSLRFTSRFRSRIWCARSSPTRASGAFVPVFSELWRRGSETSVVASTLFWLTLLVLGGLTAIFHFCSRLLLMWPFGDPGGDYELAVGLARSVPDRRAARALRDRRRDPEHVPPVRRAALARSRGTSSSWSA